MAFKELKLVFVLAVSITLIPRESTTYLVTSPEGKRFEVPAGRPFAITCYLTGRYSKIQDMTWNYAISAFGRNISMQSTDPVLKLSFFNPTSDKSGTYICRCISVDQYGRHGTSEKSVDINFYNPELRFQATFENIIVKESTDLVLNCSAIGDESIMYEWYNQYQEVISSDSSSRIYVSASWGESVLHIRNISSSEAGSYTCTASNVYGQARKKYEILICSSGDENKCTSAPYVRHVQVVNLTANSVQFGISAPGAPSLIIVRYSTKPPDTVYEKEWKRGDTYEVKGLDPGNSYIFRFKTAPLDSSSRETTDDDISNTVEVTMLPLKPDVVLHALSGGSVKIERNRKNEDKKVDRYKLMYFPIRLDKKGNWAPSSCPITIDIPTCSSVNYTVSGLRSKIYYELQLQGHTTSGYGEPYKQKIYVQ